jgi:membrane fusion protein (multidrug efflux system)
MLAVAVALGGIKFFQIKKAIAQHAGFQPPPEAITSASVRQEKWKGSFETVGTFTAVQGVTLGAEVAGQVTDVAFQSGAHVDSGQVLIKLDTSVEEANLRAAQSRADLARQNLSRAQNLKSQSAMSEATVEDAQSKLRQAEAEVQSLKATIAKKTITAPFTGRTGIRMVNVGQYVAAGDQLVPLYSMDPIYFNFSVPQQVVGELGSKSVVTVRVDAFPAREFKGEVTAVNPNVDEVTRNVQVQASFANKSEELRPGMFGSVAVELGEARDVLVVPASSLSYTPYGNFVFVIEERQDKEGKPMKAVRQQKVDIGQRRGDLVVITQGIKAGEEVATSGVFKLRQDATVLVDNKVTPSSDIKPVVQDS